MSQSNSYILSVAPMMDWTDRHYRYFMRLLTKRTLLYTEMITTGAILRGGHEKHLAFSVEELPLALQLGGDDPKALAECSQIGEDYGYSEINLNVGCPSDRVQNGAFGACLMREPSKVAEMVAKCKSVTNLPVTVKHRIGINGMDSLEDLIHFVGTIKSAGVDRIIVHARIAILEGLTPAENRSIPPLRYDDVYRIKELFPDLAVVINGGIKTLSESKHQLKRVDGVMLGRAAYENPYIFSEADSIFFQVENPGHTREEVLELLAMYLKAQSKIGVRPHHLMRHVLGLYHGLPGARFFRRYFSENMFGAGVSQQIIENFLEQAKEEKLKYA